MFTSAGKRRDEGDGERRSMEATISGYGDGLIETPMAYYLPIARYSAMNK